MKTGKTCSRIDLQTRSEVAGSGEVARRDAESSAGDDDGDRQQADGDAGQREGH